MPYTLLSSVDDCIIRNPFLAYYGFDVESTENTLVRHALFGNPVLIDSAFFVENPVLKNLITSEGENILKHLIRLKRVFIFSETGNIAGDVAVKRARNEQRALLRDIDELKVRFSSAEQWLGRLPATPYIIIPASGSMAVAMRRVLIEKLVAVEHPWAIGFYTSRRSYEKFRTTLLNNLNTMSPRSSCEQALHAIKGEDLKDYRMLVSDVMTFANEAFHLAMAASLAETHKMDVAIETIYSNRFSSEIPYKASPLSNRKAVIHVPIQPVFDNKGDILTRLFLDEHLNYAREEYIRDTSSDARAQTYEKAIYDGLGFAKSYSEQVKSVERVTTATSLGAMAAMVALIESYKDRFLTRRGFMRATIEQATVVSLFTGGVDTAIRHVGKELVRIKIEDSITDKATELMIIDGVRRSEDKDRHLENVLHVLNEPKPKFALEGMIRYNAPITNLYPDTNSQVFLNWKQNGNFG